MSEVNSASKNETSEPVPPSSSAFSEIISKLVSSVGRSMKRSSTVSNSTTTAATDPSKPDNSINSISSSQKMATPATSFWPSSHWPSKRSCNAPPSRRFANPCSCSNPRLQQSPPNTTTNNGTATGNSNSLPPPSAGPVYLYDPVSKKCLPTTRNRDMLLKDCHSHAVNTHPSKPQQQNLSCYYDDLTCDPRRFRCVCKPPLQLYYESNQTAFGCVPMGPTSSPDGRINCRPGQVYNVISRDCQKIFDVSELPPTNIASVSAIQFLFVTFTLIWFLLLILLVTSKLKKLKTLNIYRGGGGGNSGGSGSPATERRRLEGSRRGHSRHYHQGHHQGTSAWLHPFIAAVNGHHRLNQHRTTVDRHTQSILVDESGPYSDTDFFLANGTRRSNDHLYSDRNFSSSQLSLNNPPPKFEEIYPSCPADQRQTIGIQPRVSTEDLPSYDEAMKLQGGDGGGGGDIRSSPAEKE